MDTKLVKILDAIGELSLSIDILTGFKYGLDHTSFQAKQNAIRHIKIALDIVESVEIPEPQLEDKLHQPDLINLDEMTDFINSCNWDK